MTATSTRAGLLTRDDVADLVVRAVQVDVVDEGGRAAMQGASDAVTRWRAGDVDDDLDVWADDTAATVLDDLLSGLNAARVQHSDNPHRLRHTSYAIETPTGFALVDVTRGDLRVGPVLLQPAAVVDVTSDGGVPRLAGPAAVADLLLRKLLRGGLPDPDRLDEARKAWTGLAPAEQRAVIDRFRHELPAAPADTVAAVLAGAAPTADLPARCRKALLRRTLSPRDLPAAWAERHVVVPAGRRAGPLGLRTRGALVVLVGTDGAGKSTVAAELASRLEALGMPTQAAYFGMARGNLPGVGLARRVLGIAAAGDGSGEQVAAAPQPDPPAPGPAGSRTTDPRAGLAHPGVRRLAAWYYAGEYAVRWLRDVAPGMRRRHVVVADRYVYDLRESPWPGSLAARAAQAVLPDPDVLVLPDAPAEQIHARKPERPLAEQAAQQERFRALLAEHPATGAEIVVDTSGATADAIAPLVAAVVTAAHLPPRARRRRGR